MAFKFSNEIKTGLIVLVAVALLIWGFQFLKGKNLFENRNTFYAVYDRVDGMSESNPVLINGLKVGLVSDIFFHSDSSGRILIKMLIDKSYKLPDSTVAEIYSIDIMGNRAVRLNLTKHKKYHKSGDTLISSIEQDLKSQVSAQMLPLKVKAEELLLSIDSVMSVIQNIFNENTRENLTKTFASIKATLQNLEHTSIALDTLVQNEKWVLARIFSNIESITLNLKNNNEQITKIMNNLSMVSDSLVQANIKNTIVNANKVLVHANSIMEKINRGEGTFGLLINNDTLYRNLESASKNLDLLMKDLQQNPKRYVHFSIFDFGRTVIIDEKGNSKPKRNRRNNQSEEPTSDNKVIYKIQIKSAKKQIPKNARDFKEVEDVQEDYTGGWYKYTTGSFETIEDAYQYHSEISARFPDAFVVAFKGGSQISLKEAKEF